MEKCLFLGAADTQFLWLYGPRRPPPGGMNPMKATKPRTYHRRGREKESYKSKDGWMKVPKIETEMREINYEFKGFNSLHNFHYVLVN